MTKVRSYEDWCDQSGVTLVQIGPQWRRDQQWWRDPDRHVSNELARRYEANAALPADAEGTGWHRHGRELWLVPDGSAAYLVSTADPEDVER